MARTTNDQMAILMANDKQALVRIVLDERVINKDICKERDEAIAALQKAKADLRSWEIAAKRADEAEAAARRSSLTGLSRSEGVNKLIGLGYAREDAEEIVAEWIADTRGFVGRKA